MMVSDARRIALAWSEHGETESRKNKTPRRASCFSGGDGGMVHPSQPINFKAFVNNILHCLMVRLNLALAHLNGSLVDAPKLGVEAF